MKTTRILISGAFAILTLHFALPATAAPALVDIWTWRNPSPSANLLNAVTYGNGLFVAVGANSTILTSPDGINWAQQTVPINTSLSGVAYNPDSTPEFVAVGADAYTGMTNVILTSPNGFAWSAVNQNLGTNGLLAVAYGGGVFVVVGNGGTNWYLSGGHPWTQGPTVDSGATSLTGITYGKVSGSASFVVVGSSGAIYNSANGTSWTPQTSGTTSDLYGITYSGSTFVAVGNPGLFYSSNGTTWASTATGANFYGNAVVYSGTTFVAVGAEADSVITSTDGQNWTNYGGPWDFEAIAYGSSGGGAFVAVGGTYDSSIIDYSSTGISWTPVSTNVVTGGLRAMAYGATASGSALYVAGGGGYSSLFPVVVTSTNGFNWQVDTDPSINPTGSGSYSSPLYSAFINGLACGKTSTGTNEFVATMNALSGYQGFTSYIYSSTNGIFWTLNYGFGKQGSGEVLSSIAYGALPVGTPPVSTPFFVAVGGTYELGASASSSDLIHWTTNASSPLITNGLMAVTYGAPTVNGSVSPRFVAVGDSGQTAFSTDGVTWTLGQDTYPTNTLEGVAYGNGAFVAVGGGVIYNSPDGENWSLDTKFTPSFLESFEQLYLVSVTFADGLFVAVSSGDGGSPYGEGGAMYASTDGINWTQTFAPTGLGLSAVGSGGGQFIAFGGNGTILGSVLPAASDQSFDPKTGVFSFEVCGPPGTYGVYVSQDLVNWSKLGAPVTFTSNTPCQPINDADAGNFTHGFYALGSP